MPPHLLTSLRTIADYLRLQEQFAGVRGFLHDLEGYALFELAAHGPGIGAIVEIGSFLGRSTMFLAAGARSTGREQVVAIDHFQGSPEHQSGQPHADPEIATAGSTFPAFCENLRRCQLEEQVVPQVATSMEAAAKWKGPIRLLFIDGDHSYESSRADFEAWAPHVVRHGLICFHDIPHWPGVTRFYEELLSPASGYEQVGGVLSLRIVQRRHG